MHKCIATCYIGLCDNEKLYLNKVALKLSIAISLMYNVYVYCNSVDIVNVAIATVAIVIIAIILSYRAIYIITQL